MNIEISDLKKINNIFVKLFSFFKSDVIITYDGYIVDLFSDLAIETHIGRFVVKLDDKLNDLFHQYINSLDINNFTNSDLLKCTPKDLKLSTSGKDFDKDKFADYMSDNIQLYTKITNDGGNAFKELISQIQNIITKYEDYSSLPESNYVYLKNVENLYDKVFNENEAFSLGPTNKDIPSVTISKALLPTVTTKTFQTTKYFTIPAHNITYMLVILTSIEGINIQMYYYYIGI